jgi:hypothetical protein
LKPGIHFAKDIKPKDGLATLRILLVTRGNPQIGSLIIPVAEIN